MVIFDKNCVSLFLVEYGHKFSLHRVDDSSMKSNHLSYWQLQINSLAFALNLLLEFQCEWSSTTTLWSEIIVGDTLAPTTHPDRMRQARNSTLSRWYDIIWVICLCVMWLQTCRDWEHSPHVSQKYYDIWHQLRISPYMPENANECINLPPWNLELVWY